MINKININTELEKNNFFNGQKTANFLISLNTPKKDIKKEHIKEDKKLNVCFVLDISSSMDESINRFISKDFNNNLFLPNRIYQNHNESNSTYMTKMMLAKKATIDAINTLPLNSIVSIVLFDNKVEILQPSILINSSIKTELISKINSVKTRGSTDLHSGWLNGALEVTKSLAENQINRVILLTDGQSNAGLIDKNEICKQVSKLSEQKITTTTFGIGQGFNEDLLHEMSKSGNGNFYFIDNETSFLKLFQEEFDGIKNIYADKIQITFNLDDIFIDIKSMNETSYIKNDKQIIFEIPYLTFEETRENFFQILLSDKKFKQNNIEINIVAYLNHEIIFEEKTNNKFKCLSFKKWELEKNTEKFNIEKTIVEINKMRKEAIMNMDSGNLNFVKQSLNSTTAIVASAAMQFNNEKLKKEVESLEKTMKSIEDNDIVSSRKTMLYGSYRSMRGKDL